MRKHIFAAAILLVMPAAVAQAETPQEQFKATYEKAEATNKKAGELRNQWTTTAKTLKAAKAAADAGDFDKATKLAHEAEALANASIAQAEHEKTLWKDAVVR